MTQLEGDVATAVAATANQRLTMASEVVVVNGKMYKSPCSLPPPPQYLPSNLH